MFTIIEKKELIVRKTQIMEQYIITMFMTTIGRGFTLIAGLESLIILIFMKIICMIMIMAL